MDEQEKNEAIKQLREDEESKAILNTLSESEDHVLAVPDIRNETLIDRQKIKYRERKLEDLGLIRSEPAPERAQGNRTPPNKYILTEKGKTLIRSGDLLGGEVLDTGEPDEITMDKKQIEDFNNRLNKMENQMNLWKAGLDPDSEVDAEEMKETLEKLSSNMEELNSKYTKWVNYTKSYMAAVHMILQEELDRNLKEKQEEVMQKDKNIDNEVSSNQ